MDLVEQLRRDAYAPHFTSVGAANLMLKAADEVEQLRAMMLRLVDDFSQKNRDEARRMLHRRFENTQ